MIATWRGEMSKGGTSTAWRLKPVPHPSGTAASHPTDHVWPLPLLQLWAPRDPREVLTSTAEPWPKARVHKASGVLGRRRLQPAAGCCKGTAGSLRLQRGRSSPLLTCWRLWATSSCFPKSRYRRAHRGGAQKGADTLRRGVEGVSFIHRNPSLEDQVCNSAAGSSSPKPRP